MMKKVIFVVIFGLFFSSDGFSRIYITVKGANISKAKIALATLYPLPGYRPGNPRLGNDISNQVRSDLRFTNLFEFVDNSVFSSLDQANKLYEMEYERWALTGSSFVLKLGYKVVGPRLILEALLYDVKGRAKIFGTRYQFQRREYPKLVHALVEDILKELTGERGLFHSKILMVCHGRRVRGKLTKEIFVVDPDGKNFKAITSDGRLSLSPAWAPDGKSISYTQYQKRPVRLPSKNLASKGSKKRRKQIFKEKPVLKTHNLVTGARRIISDRKGMKGVAVWSPDGSNMAASLSFTGRPEIYLIPNGGRGRPVPFSRNVRIRRITGKGFQPTYPSLLFDVEPSWSPDGKEIVFSSARSGHPMIYVTDVASKIGRQLTFAGTYNSSPGWSPKGDKIAFAAQRIGTGNFDIYLIDPDGNNLKRLTTGGKFGRRIVHSENPTWAPTGRHLAYASNESGRYSIYVMTIDRAYRKRVSPPNLECTTPSWGPAEK